MKQLSVMLKPASSLCNMRCKYCFYADVSSLRDVSSYGPVSYTHLAAKQQAGVARTVFLPSTFMVSLPASSAPQPWQLF